jgi:hypothetical protein
VAHRVQNIGDHRFIGDLLVRLKRFQRWLISTQTIKYRQQHLKTSHFSLMLYVPDRLILVSLLHGFHYITRYQFNFKWTRLTVSSSSFVFNRQLRLCSTNPGPERSPHRSSNPTVSNGTVARRCRTVT